MAHRGEKFRFGQIGRLGGILGVGQLAGARGHQILEMLLVGAQLVEGDAGELPGDPEAEGEAGHLQNGGVRGAGTESEGPQARRGRRQPVERRPPVPRSPRPAPRRQWPKTARAESPDRWRAAETSKLSQATKRARARLIVQTVGQRLTSAGAATQPPSQGASRSGTTRKMPRASDMVVMAVRMKKPSTVRPGR